MVSLTILSFILVILFGTFRLGIHAWERGEVIKETYQKIRMVSQLITRQVKSVVPYKIQTKKAEGDYLAFEGKPQTLKFISTLSAKMHRPEGFVYTIYHFKEEGKEGGKLILYEQRVLNRDFFEEEIEEEKGNILMEGISNVLFEYYQEEDPSKNQIEAWLEEWSAKERKELPKAIKMTVTFKDTERGDFSYTLFLPLYAYRYETVSLPPFMRRERLERVR